MSDRKSVVKSIQEFQKNKHTPALAYETVKLHVVVLLLFRGRQQLHHQICPITCVLQLSSLNVAQRLNISLLFINI